MGIQVEFNPDLALRNIRFYEDGKRKKAECIPPDLEAGKTYTFLKEGQRNYWLMGEIPLLETQGNQKLSRPIASIIIQSATHLLVEGKPYTKGEYRVVEIFDDDAVHFNGFARVNAAPSR